MVGGGKSFALLLDALKYVGQEATFLAFFRKTVKQLDNTLWPLAKKLYRPFLVYPEGHPKAGKFIGKANIKEAAKTIYFPSGAKLLFTYLDRYVDAENNLQGTELTGIYFDELTHFSYDVVACARTRLRSMTTFNGFMRASCNPDADSWVRDWVELYLDDEGYARKELSGKRSYLVFDDKGQARFFWSIEEVKKEYPKEDPIPFSFIPSSITDNPKMLEMNPNYIRNLKGSDPVLTKALLEGNWYYQPQASSYFSREWCENVHKAPARAKRVRAWDLASSEPSEAYRNPDWTAGVKMSKCIEGFYYLEGAVKFRKKSGERDAAMLDVASEDGRDCLVGIPSDAGQAGDYAATELCKKFINSGYRTKKVKVGGKSKLSRFEPFSSAAQCGLVRIVVPTWDRVELEYFLKQLEGFQDNGKGKDD